MFNLKTALVALTTALCISLSFSQTMSDAKKERLKSKMKRHWQYQSTQQGSTRVKDSVWNTSNGWNYWEVATAQIPCEVLFEIFGELVAETIAEGPSEFSHIVDFFNTGWHKDLSGKELVSTITKDMTIDGTGQPINGTITSVDSVTFSDTLITLFQSTTSDTISGFIRFNAAGKPLQLRVVNNPEVMDEIFYTYEDDKVKEIFFRETDLDGSGTIVGEIVQEGCRFTYGENGKVKSIDLIVEELNANLEVINSEEYVYADYFYNAENQISEIIEYDSDTLKIPTDKRLFTYNSNGKVISSVEYSWDEVLEKWDHEIWDDSTSFHYNSDGNLRRVEDFNWNDTLFSLYDETDYTYDTKGNVISEITYRYYNNEPTLDDSTIYSFNDDNNLIKMSEIYNTGDIPRITTISYSNKTPMDILEIQGDSATLFELQWAEITPIVHPQNISKSHKVNAHLTGKNLQISGLTEKEISLELYNALGKRISSRSMQVTTGHVSLPLINLAKGVYFIKLSAGEQSIVQKIRIK